MGLKRRHKKNQAHFDPHRVVKLDHKVKCYVVDEAPPYPMIAIPRQLHKREHYFSEDESDSNDSDDSSSCSSSSDHSFVEYFVSSDNVENKSLIRMCTDNMEADLYGGGSAPVDPKNMLGKYTCYFSFQFDSVMGDSLF